MTDIDPMDDHQKNATRYALFTTKTLGYDPVFSEPLYDISVLKCALRVNKAATEIENLRHEVKHFKS